MQKLVNVIAITSGVVSLAVVGLGGYVFIRKDAIIEDAKTKILEQVTGGLGGALVPDGIGGAGPEYGAPELVTGGKKTSTSANAYIDGGIVPN